MWFRRQRRNSEFSEEIQSHIAMETERLIQEGLSADEARTAAQRAFGNVVAVQERLHESLGIVWLDHLLQDLRYALRTLRKNPSFTVIAILTLAFGIGANTAIFSFVNSLLLKPFPFEEQERLVTVQESSPQKPLFVTAPDYVDWKQSNSVLEELAAFSYATWNLSDPGGQSGDPESIFSADVSENFFRTLRSRPLIGRTFAPEEEQDGKDRVVILSYGLWTRRYGADREILNRQIWLDERPYSVVGVMPQDFGFPLGGVQLWTSLVLTAEDRFYNRRSHNIGTVGRLRKGVTLEQARKDFEAVSRRLQERYPDTNSGRGTRVLQLRDAQGEYVDPFLFMGQVCTLFILILVCVNVSNLQLARVVSRRKEITLRTALGAGRSRIARLVLAESLFVSLAGGCLAPIFAEVWVRFLKRGVPPTVERFILGFKDISVDGNVLIFTLAIAVAAGILSGLPAVLQSCGLAPIEGLRDSAHSGHSRDRVALRRMLAVAEVALALVVTISTIQTVKGFRQMSDGYRGFSADAVVTILTMLPETRYKDLLKTAAFYDELSDSVAANPGVLGVAVATNLPVGFVPNMSAEFRIEGRPNPERAGPWTDVQLISADYFRTLQIPLLQGRWFGRQDGSYDSRTAVISESMARLHFPNENPIGKTLHVVGWRDGGPPLRVVGVVGNVLQNWFDPVQRPVLYLPMLQFPWRQMYLIVRGTEAEETLVATARAEIRKLDPGIPASDARPLSAAIAESNAGLRQSAVVMQMFAAVAMLLSCLGVYGVMAYSVKQRQREFGIRMALGARPRKLFQSVLKQGLAIACLGVGVGLPIAIAFIHVLSRVVFGLTATSPITTLQISLFLIAAVLAACYIPARIATRVDPAKCLRSE